ncbi:hypothetical protein WA026_003192 [Henosepilachna vigintioctopunctata]|uniref:Jumonji domain-containing protein 4 n=1 Tax=Henosepilachna vigintioctopunctata TaxID=420089 RepID=A0AAW1TMD0_9CUCU
MGQNDNDVMTKLNENKIPQFYETEISYVDFFQNFLKANAPCIIKNVALNWYSTQLWTSSKKPCFEYLRNKYGTSNVTVYKCNEKYFNSQPTLDMRFEEYINYWKNYIDNDYSADLPLYYLKDWHLKNEYKNDNFYEVPKFFSSDWLNEYLTNFNKDDYRFVYMGPKGSWTPFHQDVFASYSWSVNICGKKKWILFPPGEQKKLCDKFGKLPHTIDIVPTNVNYYEVIQDEGDAIFVPSGWHHQVWNLDDTISINHNWVNGCNVKLIWDALKFNHDCVKKEISDCLEMENYSEQCQLLLKITFGIDFEEFFRFLEYIASKRLESFSQIKNNKTTSSSWHLIFDLRSVGEVLTLLKEFKDLESGTNLIKLKNDASVVIEKIFCKIRKK